MMTLRNSVRLATCLFACAAVSGCGASLKPNADGSIAGFIPVSSLEAPMNAVGAAYGAAGAGTAIVRADKALVQRYNPAVKPFPTVSVTTQFLDSTGAEVKPFFDAAGNPSLDMVETPEYGPRTTRLKLGAASPAPIVVDQALIQKALQMYTEAAQASATGVPLLTPPAVDTAAPVQQIPADAPEGFNAIREE